MIKQLLFLLLPFLLFACGGSNLNQNTSPAKSSMDADAKAIFAKSETKLGDYWYQGKAEISRFTLEQNRYKDVHPGEAILIFVTEDFLTDKQVKNERYENPNSTPILKNNFLRKFTTGIYDYSIMTSVFTPVETRKYPQTLKVTSSSQEWCGQTFMQLNFRKNAYRMQLHSYFEAEGDQDKKVSYAMLEDELLNRIRMNPASLPTGDFEMYPSTTYARLKHTSFEPQAVKASLSDYQGDTFTGNNLQSYKVAFPDLNRELEIVFEKKSPYKIAGWKDRYPSAFDQQVRETIAKRTHLIMSDYWNKNSLEDHELRSELGTD